MAELCLRRLVHEDLDALLALYGYLHAEDAPLPPRQTVATVWEEMLANLRIYPLAGFIGTQMVCSCVLTISPNLTRACRPYGQIENVVTHGDHRRKAYGRTLLAYAQDIAWQQGCYKLMLMTGRQDAATTAFYLAAGFDSHAKQAFYIAAPKMSARRGAQ
jgi:GNAT superfamily N-acetyltransferase